MTCDTRHAKIYIQNVQETFETNSYLDSGVRESMSFNSEIQSQRNSRTMYMYERSIHSTKAEKYFGQIMKIIRSANTSLPDLCIHSGTYVTLTSIPSSTSQIVSSTEITIRSAETKTRSDVRMPAVNRRLLEARGIAR